MNSLIKKNGFLQGVVAAIPVAIGYLPISITFGVISIKYGIPLSQTVLMSATVFAGASQFMAVNMLVMNAGGIEIIMATFILNLRHFVMSMSMVNSLKDVPKLWKIVLSFGITDETFAVTVLKKNETEINYFFVFGLIITAYGSWVIGTLLGGLFANVIPSFICEGMAIALYAMFIGLLVPSIQKNVKIGVIVIVSMFLCTIFTTLYSGKGSIIFATIFGSLFGAIFIQED
jgi:4-azaleucine resistance transporter AzlC